jgi:TPR repeat protein
MEARRVWRSKIGWQLTREELTRILADVSKASEMGDWGARALLAHFYFYGLGSLESNHVLDANPDMAVDIQRLAAKEMQPWALYDLGVAYEHGYGGVPYDENVAWAYYLRAAQLGSPEAQMALASAYSKAGRLEDVAKMLKCAYNQGHGPAAYELGLNGRVDDRFKDAIDFYQNGVKYGCARCAAALELLFMRGHWLHAQQEEMDRLRELHVTRDPERERRYNAIYEALKINPDLRLKGLEKILPLPPADLPEWSGIEAAIEPEPEGPPTY